MKKCKICGGNCVNVGGGTYECDCCGSTYSEEDFGISSPPKKNAAETKNDSAGVDIFQMNVNGVLEVNCRCGDAAWCGSGYLISESGYAVTNAHVALNPDLTPCTQIVVRIAGENVRAKVAATATRDKNYFGTPSDLALLKLERVPFGATVTKFADYATVKTGERIFIIGNSLGDGTCITNGIVSDRLRNGLLMHDCAQNGGNSGGPAFNVDGLVIGTNVAGRLDGKGGRAEGMNYSIPSDKTVEFVYKCNCGVSLK